MGAAAIRIVIMHFLCLRCVPNRSPNIYTNIGENQSNNKEMAAVFRNPNGGGRHLELWLRRLFDVTDVI